VGRSVVVEGGWRPLER